MQIACKGYLEWKMAAGQFDVLQAYTSNTGLKQWKT